MKPDNKRRNEGAASLPFRNPLLRKWQIKYINIAGSPVGKRFPGKLRRGNGELDKGRQAWY
jgi:hypothetical protein